MFTAGMAAGTAVPLTVIRNGDKVKLTATIAELPVLLTLGLRLRDLPPEFARTFPNAPEKVVIVEHVDPNSPAAQAGLRPRVRVVAIGKTPVNTKAECAALAAKLDPATGVPIHIQTTDGRSYLVEIGGSSNGIRPE
jgi:S1-C subfamily serine protease